MGGDAAGEGVGEDAAGEGVGEDAGGVAKGYHKGATWAQDPINQWVEGGQ